MKNNFHFYIKITIGIAILIGLGLAARFSHHPPQWTNASKVIDSGLLTQIIQDNSTENINPETIRVMKLDEKNDLLDEKIYLIDFNSQQLCGQAGCLYVAYTKGGERVLNLILQPQSDLFSINSSDPNRTCIDIKQPQDNQILIHTYCHEGDKFIKTIFSAIN